jgi:hypothetical protein
MDEKMQYTSSVMADAMTPSHQGEGLMKPPVGEEQVRKAMDTLRRYKAGKANLEKRIIENEQFWKLRHWDMMRGEDGNPRDPRPASAWLVNVVLNRHADAIDNYPEPNCLPRAADDQKEAQKLTKILPVILKQNGFGQVYSDVWWYKLKAGTGVYGVFWDSDKLNGLGDIAIRKVDILNLFWEPGITNIQDSRNIFHVEMVDNDVLVEQYPQLQGKLRGTTQQVSRFLYDDSVDNTDKSAVVDWYYKRRVNGKDVLQYCKFCENVVLFASENEMQRPTAEQPVTDPMTGAPVADPVTGMPAVQTVETGPSMAERGWYDHGKYPFVMDVLYPEEGTPCGFGFIDIAKDPQKQIDLMNQAMLKNTLAAATPRFFIRDDGAVNEAEFADWTKPFVHTNGNLGQDSILPIQSTQLQGNYVSFLQMKEQELRETSGNTEANTGSVPSSVTAASAIAALQEASGKLSRDMVNTSYRTFEEICLLCIDLIRQFYDMPREFRITGDMGREEFASYDNSGLQPKPQGSPFGVDMGYRSPVIDIEVVPQKESRYTKAEYNELALQLYGAGFFNPQAADQALACLGMMDFKGREDVMQRISQNGTLFQKLAQTQQLLLQMAQTVDALKGTNYADQIAASITGQPMMQGEEAEMPADTQESAVTQKARAQSQQAAQVR